MKKLLVGMCVVGASLLAIVTYHSVNVEQHAQSAKKVNYKQLVSEAEAVNQGTIGDGADFLLSVGWKPDNGVWHKQGYTLKLVVEKGIVVNSQLSK